MARRARKSGSNWPKGPTTQNQTGPQPQEVGTKLAQRASKAKPNWPDGEAKSTQTSPQKVRTKLARKWDLNHIQKHRKFIFDQNFKSFNFKKIATSDTLLEIRHFNDQCIIQLWSYRVQQ